MERGRIAGGNDQSDGGVPTPRARRAHLATAASALVLATAIAVYAAATGPRLIEAIPALAGVTLVLLALLGVWEDGLTYGPPLLLAGYALSLTDNEAGVDWSAPLVAVALLAVVEFGTWSLELRDGAEERVLARLPSVALLLVGGMAASALIFGVGAARIDGGLVFWVLGSAAAIVLLALISRPPRRWLT